MMQLKISSESHNEHRIAWVDLMKSIAIFFVLLYHCTLYTFDFLNGSNLVEYFRYFMRTVLSTCVPIFFFINGFLLFQKNLDLKKHIRKIIRIVILTIIWGILTLFLLMVIKNDYLSIRVFIQYLWNLQEGWINHLWYLGALVCIYIFFPLLKIVYDNSKKVFIYFTGACFILTFGNNLLNIVRTIISLFVNSDVVYTSFNFFNVFNPLRGIFGYSFVYFCMGGIIVWFYNRIISFSPCKRNILSTIGIVICSLSLFIVGVIYSKVSHTVWDVVWNGYDTIFTFFNVLFLFLLCLNFTLGNKVFLEISKNTLGIYLIHILLRQLTKPILLSIQTLCNFMGTIFYAIGILVLSLILCLILKKIPILKRLFEL